MPAPALKFGQFELHRQPLELRRGGLRQRIGGQALRLLLMLAENGGTLVSHEQLTSLLWPDSDSAESNLRVHISALRKVLGLSLGGEPFIVNQPGQGYRFVQEVTPLDSNADGRHPTTPPSARRLSMSPSRVTRLIGRGQALAAMVGGLARTRLLAIVGPGGVGKTSMAVNLAARVASDYRDGVCFVDLSTLEDGAFVAASIASALKLPVIGASPDGELAAALSVMNVLLVLDNCEHVTEAVAPLCGALLDACPDAKLLITSREPLRLPAETVWQLQPLDLPAAADDSSTTAQLLSSAAVQLFIQRVSTGSMPLSLAPADLPTVARICRDFDGLPLAIELAAAYAKALGFGGLVAGVTESLLSLRLGSRTNARHESLKALFDWGWSLLSPDAATLLAWMAVFRGRFDLGTAIAVGRDAGLAAEKVTRCVGEITEKSLLVERELAGSVGYHLLATARAYALGRLRETGAEGDARDAHARALLSSLRDAKARDEKGRGASNLEAVNVDDVRGALDWLLRPGGAPALGAELTAESSSVWLGSANPGEFERRIGVALDALANQGSQAAAHEMQLLMLRGALAFNVVGTSADRLSALQRALALSRSTGARSIEMTALWNIMGIQHTHGDYVEMYSTIDDLAHIADPHSESESAFVLRLRSLADSRSGKLNQSLILGESAIRGSRAQTRIDRDRLRYDPRATALANQAFTLWIKGCLGQSLERMGDALSAIQDRPDPPSLCYLLAYVAIPLAIWGGDLSMALARISELTGLADDHGFPFYRGFAQAFHAALTMLREPSDASQERARRAFASQPQLNRDILTTVAQALVDDVTIERARKGIAGWVTAEALRACAMRIDPGRSPLSNDRRRCLLDEAWSAAVRQGAVTWQIKTLTDVIACEANATVDGVSAKHRLTTALASYHADSRVPHLARAWAAVVG